MINPKVERKLVVPRYEYKVETMYIHFRKSEISSRSIGPEPDSVNAMQAHAALMLHCEG